ncbi:MAG: hypothetical protein IKJ30_00925 [Bacilli bacterium]|nr:hypothetical protein [Bacilli bacterium]
MQKKIGKFTIWKLALSCVLFLFLIFFTTRVTLIANSPVVYNKKYSYSGIEGNVSIKFYDEDLCVINIDGEKIVSTVSMDNNRVYLDFDNIRLFSNDVGKLELHRSNEYSKFIVLESKEVKIMFTFDIIMLIASIGSLLSSCLLLKDELFKEKSENNDDTKNADQCS